MAIAPDVKDWTWVLERTCSECGLDAANLERGRISERITETSREWETVLGRADARERPDETTWSPLEYACHVRDVHRVYAGRVSRMLSEDNPYYENWDQDATAVADRYGDQDPKSVAAELVAAGEVLSALFAGVSGDAWQRPGRRSDGAAFTVETIGRYYLHDIEHHLWDVGGRQPN